MAQDEGPPRKTTPFQKFSGMASQNDRYNTKDDEMFWLENIMRTGPRKLTSVPGPGEGLKLFGNLTPLPLFPPPISGANCVEFTGNDQQFVNNNNCGYFFNLCVPSIYVGVDSGGNAYTQVTYQDNAIGTAMSGPALSIDGAATRTNFTGYVAVYNSTSHVITLGKWVNQTLDSIPTVLGTITLPLAANDVIKISKNRTTNVVAVSVNGTLEISVADTAIAFSNPGFGIAGVGLTSDFSSQEWSNFSVSCVEYITGVSACCAPEPPGIEIKCCSSNCEFSCNLFADNPPIVIEVCGGTPPYAWSTDGPLQVNKNALDVSSQVWVSLALPFSQVSFGLRIHPVQSNCLTPQPPPVPPISHEYNAADRIGIVQFQYDCFGNYLGWSTCNESVDGTTVSCSGNDQDNSAITYPFSLVTTFPSECPIGGLLPNGVGSFSVGGSTSIQFAFDDPGFCVHQQDPGCYSPVLGLPSSPFAACQCYDYGSGEIERWYNITPIQSLGIPPAQLTVTDHLGSSASVVIDII